MPTTDYNKVAQAINTDSKTLDEKLRLIDSSLKGSIVASRTVYIQLLITALRSAKNGAQLYSRSITVLELILQSLLSKTVKREHNGYEYVLMGDGLGWATRNVGANVPEEAGNAVAWGQTDITPNNNFVGYKWYDGGKLTKYCTNAAFGKVDNWTKLVTADDAVSIKMGSPWRMPTKEEWDVLLDKNKFTWTWDSAKSGYWVISKITGYEGNKIFLPSTSNFTGNNGTTALGTYWSSTLSPDCRCAYDIRFSQNNVASESQLRCYIGYIRGVTAG